MKTYWWCCIWHRRTTRDRVVIPSGPRCFGASRCRCHRWRCHRRAPGLKREDRNVKTQTRIPIMARDYIQPMVKSWQCSNDLGNKSWSWLSRLCAHILMITPEHGLLLRVAKSISSPVQLFDVSTYNTSSDQTCFPCGVEHNNCALYCSNCVGNQFHTLTAPLACGVAQGLVPGGGQRLYCNPRWKKRIINNLNLCLHTEWRAMKVSLDTA